MAFAARACQCGTVDCARYSKAAKIFPLTRKAHSVAHHVPLFLVALGERLVDFLLQSGRLGDERRKIIERQSPPLTELAGVDRQRGSVQRREVHGQAKQAALSGMAHLPA